jgi:hypothetical protein
VITKTTPTSNPADTQARRIARWTGVAYLAMFALAIFANFVAIEGLVVPGDAAATTQAIGDQPGVFRLAIGAFLLIVLLDVGIAWGLDVVLRRTHEGMSRAAAWFRVAYSAMLGVAVALLAAVPRLVESGSDTEALRSIESFQDVWQVGLAVFGIHLVLVGILVVRSGFGPKALGWLVAAAGVAYVADTFAHVLVADYAAIASVAMVAVAAPSMIGEGWLALWLLTGRRLERA